jgi:hypothetical protein
MLSFDVDKVGLGKILERKGKKFALLELVQNSWDQKVSRVDVTLTKDPGSRYATICVEDDDPDGFKDLSHAWTLFAESDKKADTRKRGRFNMGEKLVIAICEEAEIVSTSGGVQFDATGRHHLRRRRKCGSIFTGLLKMTNDEMNECMAVMDTLIPPAETNGCVTTFNGRVLTPRTPVSTFEASLRTEVADLEGYLRPGKKVTRVNIYQPRPGETGTLYELGIPVLETGDTYHIDVLQKLPLNFDRDNVPPSYLRALRPLVLNAVYSHLSEADASSPWVQEALEQKDLSVDAIRSVVSAQHGPKAVVFDPSDPEANKLAVAAGYNVVHGNQHSQKVWANVRKARVLSPAGQITPSPKPFHPDGEPLNTVSANKWTAQERDVLARFKAIAKVLIGIDIRVELANDRKWPFRGCFGPETTKLIVNRALQDPGFWDGINEQNLSLLIHELGHYYEGDHLSDKYYRAVTSLGGRLAIAVADEPSLVQ